MGCAASRSKGHRSGPSRYILGNHHTHTIVVEPAEKTHTTPPSPAGASLNGASTPPRKQSAPKIVVQLDAEQRRRRSSAAQDKAAFAARVSEDGNSHVTRRGSYGGEQAAMPVLARKRTAAEFDVLHTLAFGTHAIVKLAFSTKDQVHVVLKMYDRSLAAADDALLDLMTREKTALATLRNQPFCEGFFGTFQDQQHVYFVKEYIPGGQLMWYLREGTRLSADAVKFYAAEVAVLIQAAHAAGMCCRNLNAGQILLDTAGHIKVADWSSAARIQEGYAPIPKTPGPTTAPEAFKPNSPGLTTAADWWSFGCVLYELLFKTLPFGRYTDDASFLEAIAAGMKPLPADVAPEVADALHQLLNPDVRYRPRNIAGIKALHLFAGIDWSMVANAELAPPIVPHLNGPADISCYPPSAMNTRLADTVGDEPCALPLDHPRFAFFG